MALLPFDLSRLQAPNAIEPLDAETLRGQFMSRFREKWAAARLIDPSLPDYDVETLETDSAVILSEAFAYVRLLDRGRVNDAVRAVLAPLATGTDLDNIAARQNVQRLEVIPAVGSTPAVMESDAQLFRRYLLSFDRASAGSHDCYLFHAFTAWPSMLDADVLGQSVHGRRGDVEVVILGPGGRAPTTPELATVRAAINGPGVRPEATSVVVLPAGRTLYSVNLALDVDSGPDPDAVKQEAIARVLAVADERCRVGGQIPLDLLSGAAYGPGVLRVTRNAPTAEIAVSSYAAPVLSGLTVTARIVG